MSNSMRWTWDERKFQENLRKHGLDFVTASAVFGDPLSLSRLDIYPNEERWQTIGMAGSLCIFVVHTYPAEQGEPSQARIISARRATKNERKDYEAGKF